ncbi:putative 5-azacytidine-induced protein 1 [Paratrimastix pyriformis]|uniref:5-azacytidine-induced protein 1 n=1 Tax=Paratrimastix pyriformis TaxID=342808 RepID=A0ABQ8UXE7_9EUKA|nr:putative 5-azacytidine-induced protein 1 [Paratrimastix pyriformis]
MSSLLNFLDSASTSTATRVPAAASQPAPPAPEFSGYRELKAKFEGMKAALDELQKQNAALKQALETSRAREKALAEQSRAELEHRLAEGDRRHQEAIASHVTFIDQLIADKDALGERCKKLVHDLEGSQHEFEEKIVARDLFHEGNLKKQRELWVTQERAKREKWQAEREREIREATAKALQPELERLIQKHKWDCAALQEKYEQDLRKQREALQADFARDLVRGQTLSLLVGGFYARVLGRDHQFYGLFLDFTHLRTHMHSHTPQQAQRQDLARRAQQDGLDAEERTQRKSHELADRYEQQLQVERAKFAGQLHAEQEKARAMLDQERQRQQELLRQAQEKEVLSAFADAIEAKRFPQRKHGIARSYRSLTCHYDPTDPVVLTRCLSSLCVVLWDPHLRRNASQTNLQERTVKLHRAELDAALAAAQTRSQEALSQQQKVAEEDRAEAIRQCWGQMEEEMKVRVPSRSAVDL